MKKTEDFESQWQGKLSQALQSRTGSRTREQVLAGGETLSDGSTARQRLVWTCQVLERMEEVADLKTRREILSECHCQYPPEDLQDIKAAYQETGQIDTALAMLQARFEAFLREGLGLEEELVEQILSRGWGPAGVHQGNQVISTKIPKSGYLREYFREDDPLRKRQLYCHCPRVREELGNDPALPGEYCYCGAGYYQGIWEEILGQPVQVEILKSVMQGDEVCSIAVHLP
jgi:hypothetical protein